VKKSICILLGKNRRECHISYYFDWNKISWAIFAFTWYNSYGEFNKISMEQLMPYSEVISDRQVPRRPVPLERPHNYTWNTNYHRAALAFPTQRLPLTRWVIVFWTDLSREAYNVPCGIVTYCNKCIHKIVCWRKHRNRVFWCTTERSIRLSILLLALPAFQSDDLKYFSFPLL
jgi:hypothetical protein